MKEKVCIEENGNIYIFVNEEDENPRIFYDKCVFKTKNMINITSEKELEELSAIWVNKKYLGLKYDDKIEKRLIECNLP